MPKRLTTEQFIYKAKLVHKDTYNYLNTKYVNNNIKIEIICKKHGSFLQEPRNHLNGCGCLICGHQKQKIPTNQFISKSNKIHKNKYDYSKVHYINSRNKVEIICKNHGSFWQSPDNHYKHGCPKCKTSKGENKIRKFLKNNKIRYEEQKIFEKCKDKISLRFDFYLPNKNNIIEFDGIYHYKNIYGDLKKQKKRDKIKNKFCKNNNIKLIRIPYWEYNNIENILINELHDIS